MRPVKRWWNVAIPAGWFCERVSSYGWNRKQRKPIAGKSALAAYEIRKIWGLAHYYKQNQNKKYCRLEDHGVTT